MLLHFQQATRGADDPQLLHIQEDPELQVYPSAGGLSYCDHARQEHLESGARDAAALVEMGTGQRGWCGETGGESFHAYVRGQECTRPINPLSKKGWSGMGIQSNDEWSVGTQNNFLHGPPMTP